MRDQASVVIIGAGIVGCSAAYHLAQLGWRDIVVLDKGDLFENDGSTSHAPGGMFLTNPSKMMTEMAKYSREFYGQFAQLDGQPVLFGTGGLEVAYTKERWRDLRRKQGWAKAYGLPSELLSPQETQQLVEILDPKVIHGAFYTPRDAVAKGVRLMTAIIRAAEALGVEFHGNTAVQDIEVQNGRIVALQTSQGRIAAEQALLCTNIWGPLLPDKYGIGIPLQAAQHLYTVTSPLAELAGETAEVRHPLMRHQDHAMYFRQHGDCYGVGSYRHVPLMVDPRDLGKTAKLPFSPEHFAAGWESATELMPALKKTEIVTKFNGMFAFTIDGYPVMGETSVKGLWSCIGLWLTHAGGAAKQIAEWMTSGAPSIDLREADITRFQPHQLLAQLCGRARRAELSRGLRPDPPAPADHAAAQSAAQPVPPAPGRAGRLLLPERRLGGGAVARGQRAAARNLRGSHPQARQLDEPVLVADPGRRASGGARGRGHVQPGRAGDHRGGWAGRAEVSQLCRGQSGRPAGRQDRVHQHAQPARRDRGRCDDHSACRRSLLDHHRRRGAAARPGLAAPARPSRRLGDDHRHLIGLCRDRPVGAKGARCAAIGGRRGCVERGLPILHQQGL